MSYNRKHQQMRNSLLDSPSDVSSPPHKKRKQSNIVPLVSATAYEPDLSQDESSMFTSIVGDGAGYTEEIVVTEDHIQVVELINEDSFQTCDDIIDPLSITQTTVLVPGGHLLSDVTTDSDKSSSVFVFKDPTFVHSSKGVGGSKRTRVWKNLKQIITAEKTYPWGPDDVAYGFIDAPPSFKPAKKYSDISGLEARYTDPQTKMRYANTDEYRRVRVLPGDTITGCLHLRKANSLVP